MACDCAKEGRIHFDRSLCACGSMHYFCDCGDQVDPCECTESDTGHDENVLQEADRITAGQRRDDYGHPLDDFAKVQGMAKALWGRGPETEEEHAIYMIFVKLAREVHAHKRDNLVDIAGYIKTYEEIVEERARRV